METRIITLLTNRSAYDIKEAADDSMTVEEFIEQLRGLPMDSKVVFKNDGGYTYGYISESGIDYEDVNDEEEEEDEEIDQVADIAERIKKNGNRPSECRCVWLENDAEIVKVGYNDSGVLGGFGDDGGFYPLDQLDEHTIDRIWYESTAKPRWAGH